MIVAVGRGMRRWREKEGADECTREGERDAVKEDDDLFNARSGTAGGGGGSIEKKAPSFL